MAMSCRAQACRVILGVTRGEGSLTALLRPHRTRSDYPLLQELCFGTCRWWYALAFILDRLLDKPLRNKDADVRALLLLGLYQLRELDLPDYAVLNETVAASRDLRKPWARGLTNGVLRNYLRQRDGLESALSSADPASRYGFLPWLYAALKSDWPDQVEGLLESANSRPPMTLRINRDKGSRDEALARLRDAGVEARPGKLSDTAIILEHPKPVTELPGFEAGQLSVQDEASQLVPGLMALQDGQRVLDACAAPGGKTGALLESGYSLEVLALDRDGARMEAVRDNLQRLGLNAEMQAADAAATDTWWDRRQFDRILLDAPCSGTGVIRRHPDIKLLRRETDVPALIVSQERLLAALWPLLRPGGLLLYSTCSLLRVENEAVIGSFLARQRDAKYERIAADWGVECPFGRQLLTDSAYGPDGFFFAPLRKIQEPDRQSG